MKKTQTVLLCALLLTSILFVALPTTTDADDIPEEEVPDPPSEPTSPPSLSGFGVDYETGWNDTTFSFWLNFSSNERPNNITVHVNVDSVAYDMWENDTKDDDWSDGKDYFWMNENRLWSKGLIPYYFYTEMNGTSNTTDTSYFEILNRAPYMLEPPLDEIYVGEELEWEGRATDEDLDPLTWTIDTNITETDVDEFEWETDNYSFKLKIKCNHTFVRWINLSVTDPYDNLAYWRWELYCLEETTDDTPDIPLRDREEPDPTERDDIRLFGEGESDPRPTDTDHNTNYVWCGSDCGGNGFAWDDENNWRNTATWTIGGYPEGNDDTASFNETADSLYLKHGVNSVVTIGALTTTSGFTGSITFSIDLIIDLAGGKNGSLNHKAAATIDVNTSNEQINMDGHLYISSAATLTERSGILIVQGAQTQQIRVQSTNKLYKLTTDTASTVGELYDNLTAFQVTIGTGSTFKCDANSRGYELWTNYTDVASCGFVSTSAGTLNLIGTATYQCNITTADASPPPINRWAGTPTDPTQVRLLLDNTTLTYGKNMGFRDTAASISSVVNVTFSNFVGTHNLYARNPRATTVMTDISITNSATTRAFWISTVGDNLITNLALSSFTGTYDIEVWWGDTGETAEFVDSNFDTSKVRTDTSAHPNAWISNNHNDVANAYKLGCRDGYSFSKSTITNDYTTGDNIELISGKFIMDEDGDAKALKIDSGATWQIGKDVADATVNLTFDDSAGAGFDGAGAGTLTTTGTATYGMTINSAGSPPTNRWNAGLANVDVTLDYTTFQDCGKVQGDGTWDVQNTTFTNSGSDYVVHLQYLSVFSDVTITTTTGDGMYMADDFTEYYNVVITSGAGQEDLKAGARLEFRYSNFDTSKVVFGALGPPTGGNLTSLHHNDVTGAYKIGTGTSGRPRNLLKSQITHDFDSGCDVEVFEGSLAIDENADADTMFVQSGAVVVQDSGTTFDMTTNLTVNGTYIGNGTITDTGNYFDFWIGGGSVWLNNSTVSSAKLAYYYGGFNFTIGNSANSTMNEWTLEAPSGIDTSFNVTFYDFSRKGSGVIWHMNVTASSGTVKFVTTNLTAGETYRSYKDGVQNTQGTASGDAYNFTVSMSTKHIYLTWVVGGPIPDIPGPGQWDSWKVGFSYSKHPFTNEVHFTAVFNYDHNASWYIWDFDGVIYESASPNITRNFKFAFYSTESVKLTIVATDGNRYWMESPIILDNSLWIALLILIITSASVIVVIHTRKARRREEFVMVESEGR